MKKIIIFGNSGSGKSTLAKHLAEKYQLSHLDLDTLAWNNTSPPLRKPIEESALAIQSFIDTSEQWVIEGCYSDLLSLITAESNEMIFMDSPVELSIENAKSRPWEPHKYESKEAQDANLSMLIEWIKAYDTRDDNFSRIAHSNLFKAFKGNKKRYTSNQDLNQL